MRMLSMMFILMVPLGCLGVTTEANARPFLPPQTHAEGATDNAVERVATRPGRPIVRDHRRGSAEKKVIRAGRNYDKVPDRKQVIVNGKRVPRKT